MPDTAELDPNARHDVIVVGGGPAGAACAIALRRRGLSVTLLERGARDAQRKSGVASSLTGPRPSPGESLSAAGQFPLRELGLWDALLLEQHRPSYLTQSSWGSAELRERHAITHRFGPDLHVDRARFDDWLRKLAMAEGARFVSSVALASVEWRPGVGRFLLLEATKPGDVKPRSFEASFVVDATGRAAWLTRRVGGRRHYHGDLICVARWYDEAVFEPSILVETTSAGWWYSAPAPGGGALAQAFVLAAEAAALRRADGFDRGLARTTHTAPRLACAKPAETIRAYAAAPAWSEWDATRPFLPIGDAAVAFDPISGSGLVFALRSALEAASVIADAHTGRRLSFPEYQAGAREVFETHLRRRRELYGAEQRWLDAPFWSRVRLSG